MRRLHHEDCADPVDGVHYADTKADAESAS